MIDRLISEIPRFFTASNVEFLVEAAGRTLLMSLVGCSIGFAFGFLLACLRRTRHPALLPARLIAIGYVEIFRRIPFLVILFLVLFGVQVAVPSASLFLIVTTSVMLGTVTRLHPQHRTHGAQRDAPLLITPRRLAPTAPSMPSAHRAQPRAPIPAPSCIAARASSGALLRRTISRVTPRARRCPSASASCGWMRRMRRPASR